MEQTRAAICTPGYLVKANSIIRSQFGDVGLFLGFKLDDDTEVCSGVILLASRCALNVGTYPGYWISLLGADAVDNYIAISAES